MVKKAVQRGRSKRPACTKAAFSLRSYSGEGGSAKAGEARDVLCSVRRASKRRENKAGGPFGYAQGRLFQHPAKRSEPRARNLWK